MASVAVARCVCCGSDDDGVVVVFLVVVICYNTSSNLGQPFKFHSFTLAAYLWQLGQGRIHRLCSRIRATSSRSRGVQFGVQDVRERGLLLSENKRSLSRHTSSRS